jgi:transcriptional regulator NrdR family protein
MKCPTCRTHELIVITMRIGAEPIVLRSCSSCDLRSWEGLDGSLPLTSVLEMAGQR